MMAARRGHHTPMEIRPVPHALRIAYSGPELTKHQDLVAGHDTKHRGPAAMRSNWYIIPHVSSVHVQCARLCPNTF